jgi:hypothetical protein
VTRSPESVDSDTLVLSIHGLRIAARRTGSGDPLLLLNGLSRPMEGTVTLIEKCNGAVGFGAVAMEHRWVVHISGGSVGRGDLTPDREAVGHLGSPFGRAEQMPSRPKVCGDAAEGGQESLRMPQRFEAFHRPFVLPGGLMRVLGAVVQIPRPPVLHRRRELTVSDLVAAQLVGNQHARHVQQALEQLAEESLGRQQKFVMDNRGYPQEPEVTCKQYDSAGAQVLDRCQSASEMRRSRYFETSPACRSSPSRATPTIHRFLDVSLWPHLTTL